MTVEVGYELDRKPTRAHERSLRFAAEELTHDVESIRVERRSDDGQQLILVHFRMPKQAQYKVADRIERAFKFHFASEHSYDDWWIRFVA